MYTTQQLDNERPRMDEYATDPADASYKAAPTTAEIQTGVSPLDVLPAQWWNFYVNQMTQMNNTFLKYIKDTMSEIAAVVAPDGSPSSNQLKKYLDEKFAAVNGDISAILATAAPKAVAASAAVGTSTQAARADHVHNYKFSTTAPLNDNTTTSGVVGSSSLPARSDHRHPLNVSTTAPLNDNTTTSGVVGTSTAYARSDHRHPLNVSTADPFVVTAYSPTTPTGSAGTATTYARSDHTHVLSRRVAASCECYNVEKAVADLVFTSGSAVVDVSDANNIVSSDLTSVTEYDSGVLFLRVAVNVALAPPSDAANSTRKALARLLLGSSIDRENAYGVIPPGTYACPVGYTPSSSASPLLAYVDGSKLDENGTYGYTVSQNVIRVPDSMICTKGAAFIKGATGSPILVAVLALSCDENLNYSAYCVGQDIANWFKLSSLHGYRTDSRYSSTCIMKA